MRLIYADPGLRSYHGHHATVCRGISDHARRRGFAPSVFGFADMDANLRSDFAATPLFHAYPYNLTDGDPYCGFMNAYFLAARVTLLDLSRMPRPSAEDLVYIPNAQGAQLLGIAEWLAGFPAGAAPAVVVDLNFLPGCEREIKDGREIWTALNPNEDPRAVTYRYTGRRMSELDLPTLSIVTAHPDWIGIYSELLMREVQVISTLPFEAKTPAFKRGGRAPLTVATLGFQSELKGLHFIPEIFAGLRAAYPELRLVAHNSNAKPVLKEAQQALRDMAARDAGVIYEARVLDAEAHQHMLASTDLMLCPYSPAHYYLASSGLVSECLANAIPVVVPADVSFSAEVERYGGGEIFAEFTAASVLAATRRLLSDYDAYAERALAGAARWAEEKGVGRYFDEIVRLVQQRR